jgi:hypothetical protein
MRTSRLVSLVAASAASAVTIGGLVFAAPSLAAPSVPQASPTAPCLAAIDAFEVEFGDAADVDEKAVIELLTQYEDLLTNAEGLVADYEAAEQASQQAQAALPALRDDVTTADAAVVAAEEALDAATAGSLGQMTITQARLIAAETTGGFEQIAIAEAALAAARAAAADAADALAAGEDAAAAADAALADASARLHALDQALADIEARLDELVGGVDIDLDRFVQLVTDMAKACQSAGPADHVDAAPVVDRTPTVHPAPVAKPVRARASFTG